jgi:hypothetical protein
MGATSKYKYKIRIVHIENWTGDHGISSRSRFWVGFGIGYRFMLGISNEIYDFRHLENGNYTRIFLGFYRLVISKIAVDWKD